MLNGGDTSPFLCYNNSVPKGNLIVKTVYVWEVRVWDGEEEEWVDYFYHTLTRDVRVARRFLFEDEGENLDYTIDLDEELPYDKWLEFYGHDPNLIRDRKEVEDLQRQT